MFYARELNMNLIINLDLQGYTVNQLYNMVVLGVISRAEYLAELDQRRDDNNTVEGA